MLSMSGKIYMRFAIVALNYSGKSLSTKFFWIKCYRKKTRLISFISRTSPMSLTFCPKKTRNLIGSLFGENAWTQEFLDLFPKVFVLNTTAKKKLFKETYGQVVVWETTTKFLARLEDDISSEKCTFLLNFSQIVTKTSSKKVWKKLVQRQ